MHIILHIGSTYYITHTSRKNITLTLSMKFQVLNRGVNIKADQFFH